MNKFLLTLLASAIITPLAHAEDSSPYYAGLTISNSGKATAISRTGERVSDKSRVAAKVFAGVNITPNFALEAGYADYGSYVLKNTGPGTSGDARLDARMLYLAGRGSYMFTERFGMFGKLGVAHSRFGQHNYGAGDVKMTRPMLGVGLQFNVTEQVALTLELDHYGKKDTGPRTRYNLNKLEAGLKFSF